MGIAAVVTSGKGGVGKSTVSVGVARALSERGRRVLLIDCDAGLRSLDRMTGVEQELVFDISDVVYARCAPIEAVYPCSGSDHLFLLPAPASAEHEIRPAVMQKLVPLLKDYYDYVILDSPAGVGTGLQASACAADRALLVCSPDPLSVRACGIVRTLLPAAAAESAGLVINRFNDAFFQTAGAYEDLDGVIDEVGVRLCGLVPEDFTLAAALLRGQPADRETCGMMALSRIAARLEGERIPVPYRQLS